jgi:hypothetical protein
MCSSYVKASSRAARREDLKRRLYDFLGKNYIFCHFAVETLDTFGEENLALSKDLARRMRVVTGEARSRLFPTKRISIEIQRENTISIPASLPQPLINFKKYYVCNLTSFTCKHKYVIMWKLT